MSAAAIEASDGVLELMSTCVSPPSETGGGVDLGYPLRRGARKG